MSEREEKLRELHERIEEVRRTSPPGSGILLTIGFPDGISQVTGAEPEILDKRTWERMYHLLHAGSTEGRMPSLDDVKAAAAPPPRPPVEHVTSASPRPPVPIEIADFSYHSAASLVDDLVAGDAATAQPRAAPSSSEIQRALQEKRVFFAAAFLPSRYREYVRLPEVHHGLGVNFVVPASGYLTNLDARPEKLEIDFDDGHGFRTVGFDQVQSVIYARPGAKILQLHATAGATVLRARFEVQVERALDMPDYTVWNNITYPEFDAEGHAFVFFGSGAQKFANPLVVSEGFPGNYSVVDLWRVFDADRFASDMLAAGWDIVIVGYEDGRKDIGSNAGIMIAVVQRILKERTSGDHDAIIFGGASMGGLVSKYALSYMIHQNMPEARQIGTYFSFDSPHLGGSVPLSIQFMLRVFYQQTRDPLLKENLDLITSDASQQMLLFFVTDNNNNLEVANPSGLRQKFLEDLRNMHELESFNGKKIGVANGCITGSGNYTPSEKLVVDWGVSALDIGVQALFYTALGTKPNVYFKGGITTKGGAGTTESSLVPRAKIDSAAGGTRDFFKEIGDALSAPFNPGGRIWYQSDPSVSSNTGCFIPTISALWMPSLSPYQQSDLSRDLTSNPPESRFSDWFASEANTPHVRITPEIKRWLFEQLGIPAPPDRRASYQQVLGQQRAPDSRVKLTRQAIAITMGGQMYSRQYGFDPRSLTWNWSDWSSRHPGFHFNDRAMKGFVCIDTWNRVAFHVLAHGSGNIYYNWFDGSSWNASAGGWLMAGTGDNSGPLRDISGAWNGNTGQFKVFVATNRGDLYQRILQVENRNTNWEFLGNIGQPVGESWNVNLCATANNRNGNVEIFANDPATGHLLHAFVDTNRGTWHPFKGDRHNLKFDKPVFMIAAAENSASKHLEMFLVTTDNQLYHNYYDGNWQGWANNRPNLALPANTAAVGVCALQSVSGADVFVTTSDGELYHNYYSFAVSTGWRGWSKTDRGLELPSTVKVSKVFANFATPLDPLDTQVELFVVSRSQALYRNELNKFGWSGWEYWPVPVDEPKTLLAADRSVEMDMPDIG
ncbi:hypothetical protein JQ625_13520 [Bradyrhizobium diazoefficiens]|nr:hypothetical protein [Bradyrhizobium diazoefficiens]MBR0775853.1 hypothetical protein [Bradyrhizobium diazoefficiens]